MLRADTEQFLSDSWSQLFFQTNDCMGINMSLAQKVDYSLIPVINVARQLFGLESREGSHGDEKHFPDHGGLFVNAKKNRWYCHSQSKGGDAIELIRFTTGCDYK